MKKLSFFFLSFLLAVPTAPSSAPDCLAPTSSASWNIPKARHRSEYAESVPPIVIALGGNAFGKGDTSAEGKLYWETLRPAAAKAAAEIAELVARGERVVVTFGNGPQVGHEFGQDTAKPLYQHVRTTQEEMGRLLKEEIEIAFLRYPDKIHDLPEVKSVVTEVEVNTQDPAWQHPTKPIGIFIKERAEALAQGRPWKPKETQKGWRLSVPSPRPQKILSLEEIKYWLHEGCVVIACGGGGIPRDQHGIYRDAVIDKDLASALLAAELEAKMLVILTEAKGISLDFKDPETSIYEPEMSVKEVDMLLRQDPEEKTFPDGSIRPKMIGGRNFAAAAKSAGNCAVIAPLGSLLDAVSGKIGTRILKSQARTAFTMPPTFKFDPRKLEAYLETAV